MRVVIDGSFDHFLDGLFHYVGHGVHARTLAFHKFNSSASADREASSGVGLVPDLDPLIYAAEVYGVRAGRIAHASGVKLDLRKINSRSLCHRFSHLESGSAGCVKLISVVDIHDFNIAGRVQVLRRELQHPHQNIDHEGWRMYKC